MKTGTFLTYDDLETGMSRERDYVITQSVYESFLALFGDRSPLHVEAVFAQQCGFREPLMHGAILNGFISNFVGMVFPGGRSLELSVDIRFLLPSFLGDTLRLRGEIAQKLDSREVVVLHLMFVNQACDATVATARVQVKMMT